MDINKDTSSLSVREKIVCFPLELRVLKSYDDATFNLHIHSLNKDGFVLNDPFYISCKDSDDVFKEFVKKTIMRGIDKYLDAVFNT